MINKKFLAVLLAAGIMFSSCPSPVWAKEPSGAEEVLKNEEAPTEEAAPAAEAEKTDDNTALQEALEAYRSARESKRVDELTEEMNGYVEAGTMTQKQADLILNSVKERMAAKNGECPNCGYQFQNNAPKMGGQKGQRGGRMMQGGQMPGNQAQPNGPMNGQQQAPRR